MTTIHEMTVRRLQKQDDRLRRHKFRRSLNDAVKEWDEEFDLSEMDDLPKRWRVPDLFRIDIQPRKIIVIEVEDTSPVKGRKLNFYVALWQILDFYDTPMELHVFDRLGRGGPVDLMEYYIASLGEDEK